MKHAEMTKARLQAELRSARRRIAGLEEALRTSGTGGPRAAACPARSLRILLVEDDALNSMLALELLRKLGHRAEPAFNGLEALEKLKGGHFDLVLMDMRMPELDGEETTARIRAGEAGEACRPVPIVAMTAHAFMGERERLLAAGMDGYLAKPICMESLSALLDQISDNMPCSPA
ncbi:MAG: response regulator [Thermodesulfobacteriota bacterium]